MWYKHFHIIENCLILKFRDRTMLMPVFYLNLCRAGVIYVTFSGKNTFHRGKQHACGALMLTGL